MQNRQGRGTIIPAGTQVECPLRHPIGVVVTPVLEGDWPAPRHMRFAPGQERVAGELMACTVCGRLYSVNGSLRTTTGWVPDSPGLERPAALPREP